LSKEGEIMETKTTEIQNCHMCDGSAGVKELHTICHAPFMNCYQEIKFLTKKPELETIIICRKLVDEGDEYTHGNETLTIPFPINMEICERTDICPICAVNIQCKYFLSWAKKGSCFKRHSFVSDKEKCNICNTNKENQNDVHKEIMEMFA